MLTLTWNGTCEFGDGAMVTHPKGLTKFGRKAIPKLEQQRIVVDISHASEPLFYDAAEIASKPLVASHSNARAVCNHPRNLTNEQVQIIKQSGGLIGSFLKEDGIATVDDLIAHAEHFYLWVLKTVWQSAVILMERIYREFAESEEFTLF